MNVFVQATVTPLHNTPTIQLGEIREADLLANICFIFFT